MDAGMGHPAIGRNGTINHGADTGPGALGCQSTSSVFIRGHPRLFFFQIDKLRDREIEVSSTDHHRFRGGAQTISVAWRRLG